MNCSILLGTLLALRRAGRYGVAYLDGLRPYARDEDVVVLGISDDDAY